MSQPDEPLEDLLAATAASDRAAFQRLYQRTCGKLFGVILRILRDRAKAEDALQDVFVKIWNKADQYDVRYGRPITWMATIARNRAIDIVRTDRPVLPVSVDDDEESVFQLGGRPDTELDPADVESLRICLAEIEETERKIVLLAYYEGYSRQELSERFDMPVGTIKTRLRRALSALRTCLERT